MAEDYNILFLVLGRRKQIPEYKLSAVYISIPDNKTVIINEEIKQKAAFKRAAFLRNSENFKKLNSFLNFS